MSNDLIVSPLAAGSIGQSTVSRQPLVMTIQSTTRVPEVQHNTALTSPLITNPTLHLDAALGLVVVEYMDNHGAITSSIPSQRALAAYQRWDVTRCGPAPDGYGDVMTIPTQEKDLAA